MKEGFEPKSFKNYNLTLAEQIELDKFLEEKVTLGHLNHLWPLHFFLLTRKMENFDPAKITSI